jgi:hypothetical protein
VRGDGSTLKHELAGTKDGKAQWHMKSASTECVLTLDTQKGMIDAVEVGGVGGRESTMKVTAAAGGSARAGVLSMATHNAEALFTVHDLSFTPGQPITFSLALDGKGVSLHNDGPAASCSLTVTDSTGQMNAHTGIALAAASTVMLSLKPSADPITAVTPLHMQVYDRAGVNLLSEAELG